LIYLLDTNAVIALLKKSPETVRGNLLVAQSRAHIAVLSSVSLQELWFGVRRSGRQQENTERLQRLLDEDFPIETFDRQDAKIAGLLRGELADAGTPIGSYDVLIAAQALRRDATLVTANEQEFARVKGLRQKNWAR
jgi:tRNA(fMet)-specific endonuclease VapC